MTQVSSSRVPSQIKPRSDVYTVLVIIAWFFVLMGTVFLFIRSHQLFGQWLPMSPDM
jgi:hypothetical protein